MLNRRLLRNSVALLLTGGCLLQVAGCVTGLAPVYLSLAESAVLSLLLGIPASP
ncbi:MAG: hypothetical protein JSU86_18240 [Phycisphaerales bacterium]|nr:MAG: hypothetical protein JSU86_18240 [Phycisphaerales bacterium]